MWFSIVPGRIMPRLGRDSTYRVVQIGGAASKTYHEDIIKFGVHEVLSVPDFEVFAFQEMNRTSGTPQNDKNIFSSLTSLMKAQAYELGALSQRKKSPSIYQFNLISIIDSDLIRLRLDGDNISQASIESEHYISRYIFIFVI
mgnify:CR=1 FL=1